MSAYPRPSRLWPFARRMMPRTAALLAAFLAGMLSAGSLAAGEQAGQMQLLMFERDGCSYCRLWHEEIGPAYPKTIEGAAAPLQRIDIKAPLPEGVTLTARHPVFTPTFVLLKDKTEAGRIEGYASNEFFWGLLNGLLTRAGWTPDDPASEDAATAP